jgi:hypothetical protein
MHTAALSLTARPHSLHAISVMVLPPKLCNQATAQGKPAAVDSAPKLPQAQKGRRFRAEIAE